MSEPMQKTRRLMIAGCAIGALCSQAQAMTGAELLQTSEPFRVGFVWGVVSSRTDFTRPDDPLWEHQYSCLRATKITAQKAHDQVVRLILNEPKRLDDEATFAVADFLMEVCGRPPDRK